MSMNTCVLMAEIVKAPELRYTPENLAIAEMLVQFPGLRDDDPPCTLKAVSFGGQATDIQQQYRQGDRVILEGRLSMNTFERPEGVHAQAGPSPRRWRYGPHGTRSRAHGSP